MNVQTGVAASQVLRAAGHVVFVEGGNDDAFDPTVVRELLKANGLQMMTVSAIGACDNGVEAAKAMVWKHPTYYFVADRDGRDDTFVENSWANFPQPNTRNLLFWRKRELENYFIEPDYLRRSEFHAKTLNELQERILTEAQRRYFLEAANLVLQKIRSAIMTPPTAWFTQVETFANRSDALRALQNSPELQQRGDEISAALSSQERERMLDEILHLLSGGNTQLQYGTGEWLNLMSGKQIFRAIAGEVFRVPNASGVPIHGRDQNNEVAKELLRKPLNHQPADFQQLVALLKNKAAV